VNDDRYYEPIRANERFDRPHETREQRRARERSEAKQMQRDKRKAA
jgi:hypothetical protein